MKIHNGVQLRDDEYDELLALAEAADNGEDVMLAAFMRLCPTGQEGAFDEAVVAAYDALADAGFIEGVREGGEFFFEDITPAGRSLTNPMFAKPVNFERDDESALFEEPIDVHAEDAETDTEIEREEEAELAHEFDTNEQNDVNEGEQPIDEQKAAETATPRENPLAALFANPSTTQAVIAGVAAGFIAGAIAAAIVTIVL